MAKVERENIGIQHDKVIVKLSKEDYMPAFERAMRQHAKTANVPGFRKGMAPMGVVRKMYGQTTFNEEVFRAAGRQLEDFMKVSKLAIFAQPMLIHDHSHSHLDMNNPGHTEFAFEIGVQPDFDLHPLKYKPPITRYKITVTDKMLEDEIARIQRRYGKTEPQEAVTADHDIIYSTFEACDAEGNAAEEDNEIEDTEELDKMPAGLKEQLMGKKPEDFIVFRPADVCTDEELPGFLKDPLKAGDDAATQYYKLTITKIGLLVPQVLGPELYEQVFRHAEVKDEAQFKEIIKRELEHEYKRIATERLHHEIYELLVHNTHMHLPVAFLKRWMREGGEQRRGEEEVEKEYGSFEHQLRWQLISDKLLRDYRINVSFDEVQRDIKTRVLAYFGLGPNDEHQAPWMAEYMANISKDEKMLDETYRRLLSAKLFAMLEKQFTVEEKEISEEEFYKLENEHAKHHHH